MNEYTNKEVYLAWLEEKHIQAKKTVIHFTGRKTKPTYKEISIIENKDEESLQIIKEELTDELFEHIKYYELDINFRDIRALLSAMNEIKFFKNSKCNTDGTQFKKEVKKFKKNLQFNKQFQVSNNVNIYRRAVLPHITLGVLLFYFNTIGMKKDTIHEIFTLFDRKRLPKQHYMETQKLKNIAEVVTQKIMGKPDLFDENIITSMIMEEMGEDYIFIV